MPNYSILAHSLYFPSLLFVFIYYACADEAKFKAELRGKASSFLFKNFFFNLWVLFFFFWGVFDFRKLRNLQKRSWAELCCLDWSCIQLFWPRVVMRKWLNISDKDSNYSADPEDDDDNYTDSDNEGLLSNLKYLLFSCSKFFSVLFF